ncbi:hypothetical protein JT358_10855 [Micrococcales bacterium 31B]|nr:hypothetical protein [Micrococcales bacterium 31B]
MKKFTVIAALGTLVLSLGTSALSATTADALASEKPSNYFPKDGRDGNAQRPTGCPGSIVERGSLNGGNYTYDTYYSSAAGGRLCMVLHNNTGKDRDMAADMTTFARGNSAYDTGIVYAYIGPVQLSNVEGKCIHATAYVWSQKEPWVRMPVNKTYQVVDGKLHMACTLFRKA